MWTHTPGTKMIRPMSNYVYVRQALNCKEVEDLDGRTCYISDGLHLPERFAETTNVCEILDIGPKCKLVSRSDIGGFVRCPEIATGLHRVGNTDDFLVRETLIEDELPAVFLPEGE